MCGSAQKSGINQVTIAQSANQCVLMTRHLERENIGREGDRKTFKLLYFPVGVFI